MSHLILTTNDLAPLQLRPTPLANIVLGFSLRFVLDRLPSEEQLVIGLEPRSAKHCNVGDHWLDDVPRCSLKGFGTRDIGFFELCEKFDSIEVWVDPLPNDQLVLVWLLNLLRPYKEITTKLSLVHTDDAVAGYHPESVAEWKLPAFKVADSHLTLASRAWQAWRAPTPECCFDLLMNDLMLLPRLRSALIALLQELPNLTTGLGLSEMAMLDYIEDGCADPQVARRAAQHQEVFDESEAGELLDDLAQCPKPMIFGLGEAPFEKDEVARYHRYRKSQVALTELGRAVVACEDDFCRHNPIHRWWGGTKLTNERLWRWDAGARALVAP
ncbi:hypothetical protein NLM33_44910 [Bradyrhizobium sp. CCGUVB1N3]|uniref:hypothetical protein n=1 Tax=Bradyrhizobium sp. CCGUVB1N3 TaxID=2949629 RepID=UPI0020B31E73|nr:hypothetical protein [Bradyrhizobium sp. CCGUVB1N3]MCP3477303.1 hypothetical protein [Bradyrhizobium sp. CCGUVB1N3]